MSEHADTIHEAQELGGSIRWQAALDALLAENQRIKLDLRQAEDTAMRLREALDTISILEGDTATGKIAREALAGDAE